MMDLSLCPAPSSLTPNTVSMCPHRQMLSLPCGSQAVSCTGHQTSVTPCTDSSGRGQENTRFSSKAPSHLLGSSRSLCRAVGGAGCWSLTAVTALCPALRRPWSVTGCQCSACDPWQEQGTHLLESGSAAPGRSASAEEPGLVSVTGAAQLQHQPCLQGTTALLVSNPSEQLPALQGCPSTARGCS